MSVALHDNDISETVLRSIDATWGEISMPRVFGWMNITLPAETPASESGSRLGFGDLLAREIHHVREERIALIAKKLEPLSSLVKRVAWNSVASEHRLFDSQLLVLHIFSSPLNADENRMSIPDLINEKSSVRDLSHRPYDEAGALLRESAKLREYFDMTKPERAKFIEILQQRVVKESDPEGVLLSLSARKEASEATLDMMAEQVDALYADIADADASLAKLELTNRRLIELKDIALSRSLGLTVKLTTTTRHWFVRKQHWKIENSKVVEVSPSSALHVVYGTDYSESPASGSRRVWTKTGFVVTWNLPIEPLAVIEKGPRLKHDD